jgi:2-hydroxymuconate-semialdehyde hydrolase
MGPAPAAIHGRFLEVRGRRVFLREARPPTPHEGIVMLLHGWVGTSSWMFRHILPQLGQHLWAIAPDLPGFGRSQPLPGRPTVDAYTSFLADLAEALGLGRFHLVGASVGGTIAINFASKHPERVGRLVVVSPIHKGSYLPRRFHLIFRLVDRPGLRELVPKAPIKWWLIVRRLDMGRDTRHLLPEDRRLMARDIMRVPNQTLISVGRQVLRMDLEREARRIRAPTLIMDGAEGRMVPPRSSEELARLIPGARLHIVPDCGHNLLLERPQEFLSLALPFLRWGAIGMA